MTLGLLDCKVFLDRLDQLESLELPVPRATLESPVDQAQTAATVSAVRLDLPELMELPVYLDRMEPAVLLVPRVTRALLAATEPPALLVRSERLG